MMSSVDTPTPITSLEQLRALATSEEPLEIVLTLRPGLAHSRKRIRYARKRNGRHWCLWEYETDQFYTEPQLLKHTQIATAIERHALFAEVA